MYLLLRRWIPLALAGLCSCALFHDFRPSWAGPPGPFRVLAEDAQYDGELLQFRVLIGAVDGGVVIDRRLIESIHVDSRTVRDCSTTAEVPFWYADWFARSPRAKDLLYLEPGDWFGREVSFLFFPREKLPDGGPECIDAYFAVRPEPVEHPKWELPLIVHAEHTTPDAGAELPSDAGAELPSDAGI